MTTKNKIKLNKLQRAEQLQETISKLFGNIDLDDMDRLAKGCSKTTMRMIEIAEIGPTSSLVMDWEENVEFGRVKFPDELTPLLRRKDTFLVTMGFKNHQWEMLYMSNPYW